MNKNTTIRKGKSEVLAFTDTLYVIGGKWKLPIIDAICKGKKRFNEIKKSIPGITKTMLSRELKHMEINKLITRTACDNMGIYVEYSFTDYASSLGPAIKEIIKWGKEHREEILKK